MIALPLPDLQLTVRELTRLVLSNPLCFFVILLFFLLLCRKKLTKGGTSNLKLPPSPPKLPIIGNLHQLGKLPHRFLHALSNKYGPLMLLHLGQTPTLVVSSAEAAKEIMKTHDIVFSNRPKSTAADIFLCGCVDLAFSPYGEYWRQVRKIAVVEFFSLKRVQSFESIREEEVEVLVDKIHSACLAEYSSVNLSEMLLLVSNNIVSRCVLGRKAEEDGETRKLGEVMRKITVQFTDFSFQNTIPFLGWMDNVSGLIARLKSTSGEMDAYLEQVIEEERRNLASDVESAKKTFVHILLQLQENDTPDLQLNQDNLKAILTDMLVGGTETTKITMEWMMSELIKDQTVMRKVQEEVRRVVGNKVKVEAADVDKMIYLKRVIKETLRLHPPAPLLLPRETSSTVELGGYRIPPKTTVIVNAMAIQTDPNLWDRPEEFFPDRFENNPVDFKGKDFQFIPFGGGRRGCPGMSFGIASAEFVISNLLCWFDWKLLLGEGPKDLDMSEDYGLTVCKKIPLRVVPTMYSP